MGRVNSSIFEDGSLARRAKEVARSHHSDHSVQFYLEDASLLDSLSRAMGTALGAGDSAIAIATKAHLDGLERRLESRGFDLEKAVSMGRYLALDAAETLSKFMLEGWPDAIRFAEIVGGIVEQSKLAAESADSRVFAFGEMVALLWAEGKSESALELEKLWNDLATTHTFSLHCAYPITGFNRQEHGEPFHRICSEHSVVIPAETYTELLDEEARLRNVSYLQQRANALVTETSDRRQAQESLRLRETELADLLENALEGIHQTGPDHKIRWANTALLKLLGYPGEEFVGHTLAEFYVHGDVFEEFWRRLLHHEDVYDFPAELKCKDGSVKHVLIHSNALWEQGVLIHARSYIRDVSDRVEIELALKLVHQELETRVTERTKELNLKNVQILEQSETLEMKNQDLRKLSAHLLQVQDEERRRIARDLHDSTGQTLALLSMNLSALRDEANASHPKLAEGLSDDIGIVKRISTELRTLSYLLHPPLLDEMGLESAIRWYVDGFGQRSSIKVSLELPEQLDRLSRSLEIAIFRIVQECLTNIHLHSGSPTAMICLRHCHNEIALEIMDQGRGISPEKLSKIASSGLSGLGLRGMRERIKDFQGEMEIFSQESGTRIKVMIPLGAGAP